MRPVPGDRTKYVGVEIECFGPLNRNTIRRKLNDVPELRGKFQVGTDTTIEPTLELELPTDETIPEGAVDIREEPHPTRRFDLGEYVYQGGTWQKIRTITYNQRTLDRREERLNNPRYYANREQDEPTAMDLGEENCYEIRVFSKQDELADTVGKVYDVLAEAGCQVNNTCGLHVHLDCRYRNPMTVYSNLYRCQNLMVALQPEDRADSEYCQLNDEYQLMNHMLDEYGDPTDKYYAINPLTYTNLRTIEVRYGEGTMDKTKALAWIEMLCAIADTEDELTTNYNDLEAFSEDFEIDETYQEALAEMQAA